MVKGLFSKIKAAFNSNGNDVVEDRKPKASDYVDWLPRHMLRNSRTELKIDSSRPLPGANEDDPDKMPPCLPDQELVVNRIKVLCGLNPFRFSEPTEGRFEKELANYRLVFTVYFDDRDSQSTCTLFLSVRA